LDKNRIDLKDLGKWAGDEEKFANAISDPLGLMDLVPWVSPNAELKMRKTLSSAQDSRVSLEAQNSTD
jgi:hypothetical protein